MSKRIPTPRTWLTDLRNAQGMSISELADIVEFTAYYISNIERGISRPSPDAAIRIGAAVGLSETDSLVKFFGKTA